MKISRVILSTTFLSMLVIACQRNSNSILNKSDDTYKIKIGSQVNNNIDTFKVTSQRVKSNERFYPNTSIVSDVPSQSIYANSATLTPLSPELSDYDARNSYNPTAQPILKNPFLNSYIWPFSKLEIGLDNDIFDNTDRYYTNGIFITYSSPAFAFWRINSILPVSNRNCMEYNTLELHHAMFTPLTTKVAPTLKNDRPYSSILYLRFSRKSVIPEKGLSLKASIDIGVIGKAAGGDFLQKSVHAGLPANDEPMGWDTQIANDFIINYTYEIRQRFFTKGTFNAFSINSVSLGTLNTSASSGIGFRISTDKDFLSPLPSTLNELSNRSSRAWKCSFETNISGTAVAYNATLNGGLMNKTSIFVLKPNEIERLLVNVEMSFNARYKKYGIQFAQNYLSKEFTKGKCHYWGRIGLTIGF